MASKKKNIKQKLESHKKVCENKDVCNVIMPSQDTKRLEFNQYIVPFVFYVDLDCVIEQIHGFKNNPEISSMRKVSEHIACLQYLYLEAQRISMMYTEIKIA